MNNELDTKWERDSMYVAVLGLAQEWQAQIAHQRAMDLRLVGIIETLLKREQAAPVAAIEEPGK